MIASILMVSAALRGMGIASVAFAETERAKESEVMNASTQNVDFQSLLIDFENREKHLDVQEKELASRMGALKGLEAEISTKYAQVLAAEKRLVQVMNLAENAAENDVTRLTAVYENMKPKDAAQVFEKMDSAFAAGFISRMKSSQAASIMSALQPETAYTISVILAGRHLD